MTDHKQEIRERFFAMKNFSDVADILGFTDAQLNYYLYLLKPKYTEFQINKKSGGTRNISAPNRRLKVLQSNLNKILQQIYEPKYSVHGFVRDKSIKTNAKAHKKKRFVLNLDLENFFPSIHFGRVKGVFLKPPYSLPESVALILARICCTYEGLPQGAPTSPVISNIICRKMDRQLEQLAKKHHCFYTRYADDITFSTSAPSFPAALAEYLDGQLHIGPELHNIIVNENSFKINLKKIRLRTPNQRQEVTGLTVNQFLNVNRSYVRQIRVMLNDWRTLHDPDAALKRHLDKNPIPEIKPNTSFQDMLRGKIEFIRFVKGNKDKVYHNLCAQLAELDPSFAETYVPLGPLNIFLNYAREDEVEVERIYLLLEANGYRPWMDNNQIQGGDNWEDRILSAIDNADLFIACLTSESVSKDGYVQKEIEYALKRQTTTQRFIIPLLLEDCKPQASLNKFDWVQYYRKGGITKLLQAIQASAQELDEN